MYKLGRFKDNNMVNFNKPKIVISHVSEGENMFTDKTSIFVNIQKIRKQDLKQTGNGLPAYKCVFKFKFQ